MKKSGISRSTVYFEAKPLKLLEKYPKLKKWSLNLNLFKNYFKSIEEVCQEKKKFSKNFVIWTLNKGC